MPEIQISQKDYAKMIRTEVAAKMAFTLLKEYVDKKWVDERADMLLAEFGEDFA